MSRLATRQSWGACEVNGDGPGVVPASEVFIHHTVTTQLPPTASVAQEQAQMRSLEQIGQQRFGRGISYHAIVFPSGRGYQGVTFDRRGTQAANRNSTSRGIAFAGNYDVNEPTDAAIATAAAIVDDGRGTWWTSAAPVRGHRDVKQTACPGRFLYARLDEIRTPRPPQEGFLMALSDSEQAEILDFVRDGGRTQLNRFIKELPTRSTSTLLAAPLEQSVGNVQRALEDTRVISRRTEQEVIALQAAVCELSQHVGADPHEITAAVTAAVERALARDEPS